MSDEAMASPSYVIFVDVQEGITLISADRFCR